MKAIKSVTTATLMLLALPAQQAFAAAQVNVAYFAPFANAIDVVPVGATAPAISGTFNLTAAFCNDTP